MKRALVAFAEPMPVILERRRGNRRIAKFWMAIDIRSKAFCHVAARGIETIVETALGNFGVCRGRWRHVDVNGPRMRTTGNGQGQRQYNKCK